MSDSAGPEKEQGQDVSRSRDRGGGDREDSGSPSSGSRERGGGREDRGRGDGGRAPEPNKLFIGQLAFDAEEDDIRDKFSRVGDIVSVQIIKDRESGKSKGFGFVKFANTSDAEKALRTMDNVEIAGR